MAKIDVKGTSVTTVTSGGVDDHISLTDIARYFNPIEFDGIRQQVAGAKP